MSQDQPKTKQVTVQKRNNNRTLILEILFACLTAFGKFIFMDWLDWKFPFIITAILLWAIYVLRIVKENPGSLVNWGFRWDNFWRVVRRIMPFGILSLVLCIGTGYILQTINLTWHIIPILLLYPVWGVIQQFLVISLVAGNLQDLGFSKPLPVIITAALLFGFVHYPYGWLMLGTFVLALFYGYVFLKDRNVYVMGLFHGWLGAIFFYTVVGRDPFMEVFGKYL